MYFIIFFELNNLIFINTKSYINKNCGPIFCAKSDGLYNICIPNKYLEVKSSSCKKGIPFNTTEPFELNHGEKEFQVVELEVYRVDKN